MKRELGPMWPFTGCGASGAWFQVLHPPPSRQQGVGHRRSFSPAPRPEAQHPPVRWHRATARTTSGSRCRWCTATEPPTTHSCALDSIISITSVQAATGTPIGSERASVGAVSTEATNKACAGVIRCRSSGRCSRHPRLDQGMDGDCCASSLFCFVCLCCPGNCACACACDRLHFTTPFACGRC